MTEGEQPREAPGLTHVRADGSAHMVDVSAKAVTAREASAAGRVLLSAARLGCYPVHPRLTFPVLPVDVLATAMRTLARGRFPAGTVHHLHHPEDAGLPLLPWIDPENFNPGYLMRGMHLLPKRLDKPEWQHTQDYWAEKDEFPAIDLTDAAFQYR